MSDIFRAYDIRGIYPQELNEENIFRIAKATAQFLKARTLVVGGDGRISTPGLRKAVIGGIIAAGCDVIDISRCTTPLLYFSVNKLDTDGGIMITASHNPPEYNGLKIVGRRAQVIYSDFGLKEIKRLSESELPQQEQKNGSIKEISILDKYVDFLVATSKVRADRIGSIKFAVDASNGVIPIVLEPLFKKLNLNPAILNFNIDGSFPGHSPDISKKENLEQLKNKVLATQANAGFAFDGDADRLTVLDEKGEKLPAEFVVGLLFKAGAGFFKNPKLPTTCVSQEP